MKLFVTKGCPRIGIMRGDVLTDVTTQHTGNGVHAVRFKRDGFPRILYARLINNDEFNMNNGDPTKNVRVVKRV